jgi:hypothetical protein
MSKKKRRPVMDTERLIHRFYDSVLLFFHIQMAIGFPIGDKACHPMSTG